MDPVSLLKYFLMDPAISYKPVTGHRPWILDNAADLEHGLLCQYNYS